MFLRSRWCLMKIKYSFISFLFLLNIVFICSCKDKKILKEEATLQISSLLNEQTKPPYYHETNEVFILDIPYLSEINYIDVRGGINSRYFLPYFFVDKQNPHMVKIYCDNGELFQKNFSKMEVL